MAEMAATKATALVEEAEAMMMEDALLHVVAG